MTLKHRKKHEDNKTTTETPVKEKQEALVNNVTSKSKWSIIKNILQCLLLLFIVPAFLNYAALVREEKALKPDGIFIDVKHGQKLLKNCQGSGLPTVILDAPIGETSDIWSLIVPSIAKLTKVCTYDRAGLGYSERPIIGMNATKNSGKPHTVERMVEDFNRLFGGEEKPWILVGADLGATVAQFYTQLNQEGVSATVFINPLFEGLFQGTDNPWSTYWFRSHMPSLQLQHVSSALGITRIGLQTGLFHAPMSYEETPDVVQNRQKYLRCKPSHMSSIVEESYFINETLSQARVLHKLRAYPRNVPMSLVWTVRYNEKISDERNKVWLKSQEMFEHTLQVHGLKPVSKTHLPGSSPAVFFTHGQRIAEVIRKSVHDWRRLSQSKY